MGGWMIFDFIFYFIFFGFAEFYFSNILPCEDCWRKTDGSNLMDDRLESRIIVANGGGCDF